MIWRKSIDWVFSAGPKGGKTWRGGKKKKKKMNMSKYLNRSKPGTKIKYVVLKTWKINKINGCLNGNITETSLYTLFNSDFI